MKNQHDIILLVDDEKDFVGGLSRHILSEFHELKLLTARSGAEALSLLDKHDICLMITDYKMPVMDGMELMAGALKKIQT